MAKKQRSAVMSAFDVREIIKKGELTSELEMERAVWAQRSLRLLGKDQPGLEPLRKQIRDLIIRYESLHWSDFDSIPKKQFTESDRAEKQAKKEFKFFKKRKELILKKLRQNGLNQNNLAAILAHSKSYTSELLSGTRSFSMNDLVIIHKLFEITLENLIYAEIPAEVEKKFSDAVEKAVTKKMKDFPAAIPLSGVVKVSKSY
ncbi:helix-turn-helix transcriptional regulator [Dyadobacter arcticus]|uniref:Antitoxin component HigA of HigAB toxin-antitoxin module n=1 Tax=Dyadobacter arcticus TaxID=1078754 RepID=A0ABX0UFC0_9BACT|nr:helix-turn-helix transcriptional regulator [Dyadobacter arcticus]NIJ51713.1 antitoxin component HigA of HigAB toxin-antitoxin module [Dyadobacter arcticus]